MFMDYWHDSPTFLNRKDTMLLWFSLSELLYLLGILAAWGFGGLVLSVLPMGSLGHWIVALAGALATVALVFVRVQGLALWKLLVLTVLSLFRRRVYVADAATLYGVAEPMLLADDAPESEALNVGSLGQALRLAERGSAQAMEQFRDPVVRQTAANRVEQGVVGTVRGIQSALREAWQTIMGRG